MIKKNKSIIIIGACALLGVLLIILSGFFTEKSTADTDSLSYEEYTSELERKIENFLLSIKGIKKAHVVVTLDTSNEHVYAQNQSTYDFFTINSNNGESPVHITDIYPTVRGIAISCTDGDNSDVKMRITKLISAYLGISTNRIEIVSIKQ